jgi:superfamily II DNA or RNA helicase
MNIKLSREEVQLKANQALEKTRRGSIIGSLGLGKTKIIINDIEFLISKGFKKFLLVGTSKMKGSFEQELDKFNKKELISNIDFTTYKSLSNCSDSYDCVYLDECHLITESHTKWLKSYRGCIRGLTGTPVKYRHEIKRVLMDTYFPIVFKFETKEAIDNEIINKLKFKVYLLNLSDKKDIHVVTKKHDFYTSEKKTYEYTSKLIEEDDNIQNRLKRASVLGKMKSRINYAKELIQSLNRCLIFCPNISIAEELCINTVHSKNKNSDINLENFKLGIIDKLSCVDQINLSQNIPNLKDCVIIYIQNSNIKNLQKIGRALRLAVNEYATIHIICYNNTIELSNLKNTISELGLSIIEYTNIK